MRITMAGAAAAHVFQRHLNGAIACAMHGHGLPHLHVRRVERDDLARICHCTANTSHFLRIAPFLCVTCGLCDAARGPAAGRVAHQRPLVSWRALHGGQLSGDAHGWVGIDEAGANSHCCPHLDVPVLRASRLKLEHEAGRGWGGGGVVRLQQAGGKWGWGTQGGRNGQET